MNELLINVLSTLLISISSFIFLFITINNYLKNKKSSKLLEVLFFFFFGLGWTLISLSMVFFGINDLSLGEIFIKLGVVSIALTANIQILLASLLFFPKKKIYIIIIGLLLLLSVIYSLLFYETLFVGGDFEFNNVQKIAILATSVLNIVTSFIFISYSRKTKNVDLSDKSLFFGIGLLITVFGSVIAALINNLIVSVILRVIITLGIFIFYIGSRIKK